jgi:hypothetical protein
MQKVLSGPDYFSWYMPTYGVYDTILRSIWDCRNLTFDGPPGRFVVVDEVGEGSANVDA